MRESESPYEAVEITLDRPRRLRLTFRALREIRDSTGMDFFAGMGELVKLDMDHLPSLICAMLRHEDKSITVERVEEMIDVHNINHAVARMYETFGVDLVQPVEGADGGGEEALPLEPSVPAGPTS